MPEPPLSRATLTPLCFINDSNHTAKKKRKKKKKPLEEEKSHCHLGMKIDIYQEWRRGERQKGMKRKKDFFRRLLVSVAIIHCNFIFIDVSMRRKVSVWGTLIVKAFQSMTRVMLHLTGSQYILYHSNEKLRLTDSFMDLLYFVVVSGATAKFKLWSIRSLGPKTSMWEFSTGTPPQVSRISHSEYRRRPTYPNFTITSSKQ